VNYCPEHDPLLLAGHVVCGTCGRRGWPTDADWVDGRQLIATYPPGCDHQTGGTWLVDPGQLAPDTRWCGVPASSTGEPCRNRRQPDGSPCRLHNRRQVS
jgi:hypothetical protein